YLLDACNRFFDTYLSEADITGAYAGVRPLISLGGDEKKSVDISRKAELFETSSGLVTITGGKLTTWRRMAKMAVDRIVERDGREAPCRTHEIPLGLPASEDDLLPVDGVDEETYALFAHRYGHAARDVLELAASEERLRRRIVPELPDLVAEAPFAALHEQATARADGPLRRTRLGILDARPLCAPDGEAAREVAEAMAPALAWDAARVEAELREWREIARAEGIAVGEPAAAS